MAETSRSQVTITLGRSGQVVKRPGPVLDSVRSVYSDTQPGPAVGSKRSVRDRLGSNVDAIQLDSKRQRGDISRLNLKAANGVDDIHLSKDDLRFKIMKRTQSAGQQNGVDLREMLSRSARSSTTSLHTQQRVPEARNGRQEMLEKKDARQDMPEPRDIRQRMPEPRDVRQRMPEPRDVRQRMPEPVEVRQRIPELNNGRQRMPEPTNVSTTGRVNSTRSSEPMSQMGLLRNSYSPWTLDHIRRRSPDRVLDTSRGVSPPRSAGEPQRRPIIRTYNDLRSATYVSRDVRELPRPMTATSFRAKASLPAGPVKPGAPLVAPLLSAAGDAQRSAYTVDEHTTVDGFLHSLGLDKYAITFNFEEVDMAALSQMGDHDLKELGIPMGPRKKILLALLSRSRRQVR